MKFSASKILSILSIVSLFSAAPARADRYADGQECCQTSCYECGCNPLYCGAWDLQVHGGVDPIVWRNRSNWVGIDFTDSVIVDFVETPKFSKLFKIPWTVGGQVGYALSDNTRVYVEFNYIQANRKENVVFSVISTELSAFSLNTTRYKLFDGYVGARYYWDRWCDRVSFFLGGKIGFTRRERNDLLNFTVGTTLVAAAADTPLYNRSTVVSGGADFGFDVCFCGNWSFVVQGAVIAAGGLIGNRNVANTELALSNFVVGSIQTELRFPVTAGVRYSF